MLTRLRSSLRMTAAALIAAVTLSGCSTFGSPDEDGGQVTTVALQEEYSAYLLYIAVEQGFFESAVEDIEPVLFTSLPAMFAAVAKGQTDFGMQALHTLWPYNVSTRTDTLKIFSAFGNQPHWYAREGSALPIAAGDWRAAVATWKGRTIGLPVLGGNYESDLKYMLRQAGLDPERDVQTTAVGVQQSAVAALDNGLVDVVAVTASSAGLIGSRGNGYEIFSEDSRPDAFDGIMTGTFFASAEQLREKPEHYRAIAEGIEQARKFVVDPANREVALRVLTDRVGFAPDVAKRVYDLDLVGISSANLSKETFDATVDVLTETGALTGPTPGYEEIIAVETTAQ
jgi:NitT/TauT family transport system substrate-binding protein